MCLLMTLKYGGRDKSLLAQVTLVLLVSIVHHLYVYVECVLTLEGGVTLVAFKRSLAVMNQEVAL